MKQLWTCGHKPPPKKMIFCPYSCIFFFFHDTELLCANSNAVVDVSNPGGAADSKTGSGT